MVQELNGKMDSNKFYYNCKKMYFWGYKEKNPFRFHKGSEKKEKQEAIYFRLLLFRPKTAPRHYCSILKILKYLVFLSQLTKKNDITLSVIVSDKLLIEVS